MKQKQVQEKPKYAAVYKFGNATVNVVAPDITIEENERRMKEMGRVVGREVIRTKPYDMTKVRSEKDIHQTNDKQIHE